MNVNYKGGLYTCAAEGNQRLTLITQYGSTVYLGTILVVSGQFPRIENIRHDTMANCNCDEPKEHHSSTKGELGLHIDICYECLEYVGAVNWV